MTKRCARWLWLIPLVLLAGGASNLPREITQPVPGQPGVEQVQQDTRAWIRSRVRWGGEVISVENSRRHSLLEILRRPLDRDGRPEPDMAAGGRFLARVTGFIDPDAYAKGRLVTLVGRIEGLQTRPVGQYPYPYPVLDVSTHYLWPPLQPVPERFRDPFYNPWYPWGWPGGYPPYR